MRVSRKTKMLSKWIDSDVPTLQIAAMKMISDDHEAHRLNGTKQEIKHDTSLKSTLIKWKPAQEGKEQRCNRQFYDLIKLRLKMVCPSRWCKVWQDLLYLSIFDIFDDN